MFSRVRAIIAVSLLATLAVGTYASTFTGGDPEQDSLRWTRKVVTLSVSASLFENPRVSGGDVEQALRSSAEAWTRASGIRFRFRRLAGERDSRVFLGADRVNSLSALQTPESLLMFSGDESSKPAKTRIVATRSGEIVEADIFLNPFLRFSTDGSVGSYDLQSVMTHELGHLLGLDHSPVKGATMFEGIAPNGHGNGAGFIPRTLSSDDVVSARSRYGVAPDSATGTVSGRIRVKGQRPLLKVWLEERSNGRVVFGRFVRPGSLFAFSAIPEGDYLLRVDSAESFWGIDPDGGLNQTEVSVVSGEDTVVNLHLGIKARGMALGLISIDGDGLGSAVPVAGAGLARLAVGLGVEFPSEVRIASTSGILGIENQFKTVSDGKELWVGGDLLLDGFLPVGEYTLVVIRADGMKSYEVGAVSVDPLSRPSAVIQRD